MVSSFQRDTAPQFARMAREAIQWDQAAAAINEGGAFWSTDLVAPALNTSKVLGEATLTPRSLEIVRIADDYAYRPELDYLQQSHGFLNVRIPPGTPIRAEYLYEDFGPSGHSVEVNGVAYPGRANLRFLGDGFTGADNAAGDATEIRHTSAPVPENGAAPALGNSWTVRSGPTAPVLYYKDRSRVHLAGVITGGLVAVGTVLFTLPIGYRPAYESWLLAPTNAGPVRLDVKTNGQVALGAGPFEAGNDWLSLDGLSFRPGFSSGLYPSFYPRTNRYPRR